MKFLYLADTHLRSSTPACRKDKDFYETQMNKLKQVIQLSKTYNADYIIHGGDLFDTHDPTTRLLHDTMAILNNCHAKWLVNPGNHDIFGANTETLRRSGLGILWQAGLIDTFAQPEDMQLGEGVIVRFLPYSLNYKETDYIFSDKSTANLYVIVTHDMLTTHFVPYEHKLISDLKTNADLVLCAHWHGQFSVQHGKTWFMNPGPLTRQTTLEARITPAVGLVTINFGNSGPWPELGPSMLTPVDHKPSSEVIDTTSTEDKAGEGLAEQFLSVIQQSSLGSMDRQQLIRSFAQVNHPHQEAIFGKEVVDNALLRLAETEKQMEVMR